LAVAAVCDHRDFERVRLSTALTERRYSTFAEISDGMNERVLGKFNSAILARCGKVILD
jgi:hypothetical protein